MCAYVVLGVYVLLYLAVDISIILVVNSNMHIVLLKHIVVLLNV